MQVAASERLKSPSRSPVKPPSQPFPFSSGFRGSKGGKGKNPDSRTALRKGRRKEPAARLAMNGEFNVARIPDTILCALNYSDSIHLRASAPGRLAADRLDKWNGCA